MNLLIAYHGVLLRVGLYLLVFWPTVGYYVYADSKKRGFANPRLRGLVLGFLGLLGALVHLGLRERWG